MQLINSVPGSFDFWTNALGLSVDILQSPDTVLTSSGRYLRRGGDEAVYLYKNAHSGKVVLAASETNLKKIDREDFENLVAASSLEIDLIPKMTNRFSVSTYDLDYFFLNAKLCDHPKSGKFNVRELVSSDLEPVNSFLSGLTNDDADTLDLQLAEDFAIGALAPNGALGAIARFARIPETERLVDITVATRNEFRGQGLGMTAVEILLEKISSKNLIPKYRVGKYNLASRAIAERLGLTCLNEFVTLNPI